ncbi:helix-turn-helix transcriptional regulator [Leuconostoc carnosum]|uniref:helix-turn-helix transcriptional regulator n=1 Tax=Leuconostoc carnosum TaxID=1252 RepID=UPI001CC237B0|nr:AraC family transcriptional regulator [Leuconostoc carnosum]
MKNNMDDLNKLADILNASAFAIHIDDEKITNLTISTKANSHLAHILVKNKTTLFNHRYQSLSYTEGHFLTCRVCDNIVICFAFDYTDIFSDNSDLMVVNSLSNLQSISQVIYTLYTQEEAPGEKVFIQHIQNCISCINLDTEEKHNDPKQLFDMETNIIQGIVHSDKQMVTKALDQLSHVQMIYSRLTPNNLLRGEKDILLGYVAILNRAIIQWNYPVELAINLHNDMIKEIELSHQIPDFFQVIREITWHYFKIVQEYHIHNFLPLAKRIHQYIKEHIGENITLDDIATGLNNTKKNLNPAFKSEYHATIKQFIKKTKIDTSKELLIASNLCLEEIADILSFNSTSYFIKTFKETVGVTPAYYRKHFFNQHLHL